MILGMGDLFAYARSMWPRGEDKVDFFALPPCLRNWHGLSEMRHSCCARTRQNEVVDLASYPGGEELAISTPKQLS